MVTGDLFPCTNYESESDDRWAVCLGCHGDGTVNRMTTTALIVAYSFMDI